VKAGGKYSQTKQEASVKAGGQQINLLLAFTLVFCLVYSSILKIEAISLSEIYVVRLSTD
jgi:hypothetical protein